MRKYIRKIMRAQGEKEYRKSLKNGRNSHVKPSSVVKYLFNQYQIERYGIDIRCANMAHGTNKKDTWSQRQAIADGLLASQNKFAKMR